MDPNKVGQLDPKLKAAYDRVMNATVTPPPPPPGSTPAPSPAQTGTTPPPPHVTTAQPLVNTPPPDTTPIQQAKSPSDHVEVTKTPGTIASKFPAYKAGTLKAKRSGNVPMILWIVLAMVFFVAYTLVWIRVLGVSLPFLP